MARRLSPECSESCDSRDDDLGFGQDGAGSEGVGTELGRPKDLGNCRSLSGHSSPESDPGLRLLSSE